MTRQEQAQAYKNYCQAIANRTGLTGQELSERIAESNRNCYAILFNNRELRQRNMTQQQLVKLAKHRVIMTEAMNKATASK